jgi:hypothetical protein
MEDGNPQTTINGTNQYIFQLVRKRLNVMEKEQSR